MSPPVPGSQTKTDDAWRASLTSEQYAILRKKGTEHPHTGQYNTFDQPGTYLCAGCNTPLYESSDKFASSCGWPAFKAGKENAIATETDRSLGMTRVEILCAACEGHLGHVFKGDSAAGHDRHCVNSTSLKFEPSQQ